MLFLTTSKRYVASVRSSALGRVYLSLIYFTLGLYPGALKSLLTGSGRLGEKSTK